MSLLLVCVSTLWFFYTLNSLIINIWSVRFPSAHSTGVCTSPSRMAHSSWGVKLSEVSLRSMQCLWTGNQPYCHFLDTAQRIMLRSFAMADGNSVFLCIYCHLLRKTIYDLLQNFCGVFLVHRYYRLTYNP